VIFFDHLRPPAASDPTAPAYKDWLHLNVMDHASGAVALINVSLHGDPRDPRARVLGTALVHHAETGWVGNVEVRGFSTASIGPNFVGLKHVALGAHPPSGAFIARGRDLDALSLELSAWAISPPLDVEERLPLGRGWISWFAIPRLRAEGEWTLHGTSYRLGQASVYHDHTWGRWHWGDDIGWEWGCFLTPAPGPSIVVARTTDRRHQPCGSPFLIVQTERGARRFVGPSIEMTTGPLRVSRPRRLPGAIAALHQDRAEPSLPATVSIRANNGFDQLELRFAAQASAQLIASDPMVRGYAFIHEIVGDFAATGRLGGRHLSAEGLGIFEYVN
jgi:hypothetical protein